MQNKRASKKLGEQLHNLRVGKNFLSRHRKKKISIKEEFDKLDYIKSKISYSLKEN